MNDLIARMTGQQPTHVNEDDSVPVPAGAATRAPARRRFRGNMRPERRRSVAAAMMGEAQEGESIFPDDAEELENVVGAKIKADGEAADHATDPEEPSSPNYAQKEPLMTPTVALVAPDVTPMATEPIDPSQVPHSAAPPHRTHEEPGAPSDVNPLDVLLGRQPRDRHEPEPRQDEPVTVESLSPEAAQTAVNAALGTAGGVTIEQGVPMPEHKVGSSKPIMEAFFKYGPRRS